MDYNKLYTRFIESRSQPTGYFEEHHILPVSLGGGDEKENIIPLTFREHFIAHRILAKMYCGKKKYLMTYALDRMLKSSDKKLKRLKMTSRTFNYIKTQIAEQKSIQWKDPVFKNKMKKKISQMVSKLWQDPEYRAKHMAGKSEQMAKAKAGLRNAWTEERKKVQLPKVWKAKKVWWSNLSEDQKIELRRKNSEAVKRAWAKKRLLSNS